MEKISFIIYKDSKKYSNIKFGSLNEAHDYITFNNHDCNSSINNHYFDFFEYPSGKFVTRQVIEEINNKFVFTDNCPVKTPRNRRFK